MSKDLMFLIPSTVCLAIAGFFGENNIADVCYGIAWGANITYWMLYIVDKIGV